MMMMMMMLLMMMVVVVMMIQSRMIVTIVMMTMMRRCRLELPSGNFAARAHAGMEGNVDQMRKEELMKYARSLGVATQTGNEKMACSPRGASRLQGSGGVSAGAFSRTRW